MHNAAASRAAACADKKPGTRRPLPGSLSLLQKAVHLVNFTRTVQPLCVNPVGRLWRYIRPLPFRVFAHRQTIFQE